MCGSSIKILMRAEKVKDDESTPSCEGFAKYRPVIFRHVNASKACETAVKRVVSKNRMEGISQKEPERFQKGFLNFQWHCLSLFVKESGIFNTRDAVAFHR